MKKIGFIILAIVAVLMVAPQAKSQALYNLLSTYSLTSDTTVNAGTSVLSTGLVGTSAGTATVVINITKISGTVAGTITLQGSLDNSNWIALTDATAVPAIATKTATDVASQSFMWRVTGNPVRYYRVSWTGTGTMSARFNAQAIIR
jgi:hypothetical protein